jgi:hypothetical protein
MLQEWYKDGKVYTFEMLYKVCISEGVFSERKDVLISDGYLPVFNHFDFFNIRGCNGTTILENDIVCTEPMLALQDYLKKYSTKSTIHENFTSLHPGQIPRIKELIDSHKVKNILIDSLFQNIDQFRYMITKCLADFIDVNIFIKSATLMEVLNDELTNHMDKYPVRNPYYKHADGTCWFNELVFTLKKNNVYELVYDANNDLEFIKPVNFQLGYNKRSVEYAEVPFVFIKEPYKSDDSDIIPKEKTNVWKQ